MHLLLYEIPYLMLAEMLNLYLKVVLWLAGSNNYIMDNCAMPMILTTGSNVEAGLHAHYLLVPAYLLLLTCIELKRR